MNAAEKAGGNTALHVACAKGNAPITSILVNALHRYKQPLTKANRQGYTPFAVACRCRHTACARILLEDDEVFEQAQSFVSLSPHPHQQQNGTNNGFHISTSDDGEAAAVADFVSMLLTGQDETMTSDSVFISPSESNIQKLQTLSSSSSLKSPSFSKILNLRQRTPHQSIRSNPNHHQTPIPSEKTPVSATASRQQIVSVSVPYSSSSSSHHLLRSSTSSLSASIEKSIVNPKMLEAIRIRPASSKFPRNDPVRIRILNLDVIDRCVEVPNQAVAVGGVRSLDVSPSRPRSTRERDLDLNLNGNGGGGGGGNDFAGTLQDRTSTVSIIGRPQSSKTNNNKASSMHVKLSTDNWRDFLQGIADNLHYQFSQSYRPTVTPQNSDEYLQYTVTNAADEDGMDAAAAGERVTSAMGRRPIIGPGGRRMTRLGSVSSIRNLPLRHKK